MSFEMKVGVEHVLDQVQPRMEEAARVADSYRHGWATASQLRGASNQLACALFDVMLGQDFDIIYKKADGGKGRIGLERSTTDDLWFSSHERGSVYLSLYSGASRATPEDHLDFILDAPCIVNQLMQEA